MVVIKMVELNSLKSKKLQELLFSEIQILKEINHPNVLKCYEVFTSNRNCYIITELCNEGDLYNKLKKQKIRPAERDNIIADIYKGLQYLATKNIIHRDLKISNIFLSSGVDKIADFGFALQCINHFRDFNIGSPLYMSPQGIIDGIYGPKTDVWAFGIIIYELFHGHTPFSYCKNEQQLRKVVVQQLQWNQLNPDIPNEIKEVIMATLQINQYNRPRIIDIINYQYIKIILYRRQNKNIGQIRFKLISKSHIECLKPNTKRQTQITENSMESKSYKRNINNKSSFLSLLSPSNSLQRGHIERHSYPNKTYSDNFSIQMMNSTNNIINSNKQYTSEGLSIYNQPSPLAIRCNTVFSQKVNNSISSIFLQHPSQLKHNIEPVVKISNSDKNISIPKNKASYLISTTINFKEAVSILHYCGLIFKYLQLLSQYSNFKSKNDQESYAVLGHYLILIIDEIENQAKQKKIKFESQNRQIREKKLRLAIEQYSSKYKKQLKNQIISQNLSQNFSNDLSLSQIISYTQKCIANCTLAFDSKKSNLYFIVNYLMSVIYRSSKILAQCFKQKDYSIFDILNKAQNNFTKEDDEKYRFKMSFIAQTSLLNV